MLFASFGEHQVTPLAFSQMELSTTMRIADAF